MPTKASIPVCTVDDVFNRRFNDGPQLAWRGGTRTNRTREVFIREIRFSVLCYASTADGEAQVCELRRYRHDSGRGR